MPTLEERITILEDIEAIKQMKAYYAMCADAKYTEDHQRKPQEEVDGIAWDQASVFSEDAIWDGGNFGVFKGKKAIYDNLRAGPWKFAVHMFLSPIIEVHGDRANGRWVIWETATLKETDTAVFLAATTEEEYLKIDGRWYTSRVKQTNHFMTPFDQPWSERKNAPFTP
jgi:hypothetical protein